MAIGVGMQRCGTVAERSLAYLPLYAQLNTQKVDTDNKDIPSIVSEIAAL